MIFNQVYSFRSGTIYVSLGLFLFSLIIGLITYKYAYDRELELSQRLQKQLVRTVQAQAEVAAFVNNEEIAGEILNGLMTNPLFLGVKIGYPLKAGQP